MITAFIIFIITSLFIGLRQIPQIHIDRPAGALVGAVLMVVFSVLTLDQAFAAIDMHTLLLLLGMMIITSYLRAAGFFELMAERILSLLKTPLQLLIFVMVSSGVLSALFVQGAEALVGEQQEKQMNVTVIPRGYADGRRTFTVVLLCDTDQSRAKGLQGFRPLLPREAALFVFHEPEAVTFWMGTVTYPIDIIFVGPDGYVVGVAQRCLPGSHEFYGSGVPVKWVVETAEGSGIMIGDRVKIEGFRAQGLGGTNRSGAGEIK